MLKYFISHRYIRHAMVASPYSINVDSWISLVQSSGKRLVIINDDGENVRMESLEKLAQTQAQSRRGRRRKRN